MIFAAFTFAVDLAATTQEFPHASDAFGKVVQITSHPSEAFFFQPQSFGDGSFGAGVIIWPQQ